MPTQWGLRVRHLRGDGSHGGISKRETVHWRKETTGNNPIPGQEAMSCHGGGRSRQKEEQLHEGMSTERDHAEPVLITRYKLLKLLQLYSE